MHFTYAASTNSDLAQGDVLEASDKLLDILAEVHPHYKDKKNKYFIVLTQTCDLVRRSTSGCSARYVSIAAVRSFESVYLREIEQNRLPHIDGMPAVPICDDKARNRIAQFLQRLINNNESHYFFLRKEPSMQFPDDCCAYLRLSIAVRANLHYDTLVNARILSLTEPFRAKLGWLVGQMYSRVGTQDWSPTDMAAYIKETLKSGVYWVDSKKAKLLDTTMRDYRAANPAGVLTEREFAELVKKIPLRKELVLSKMRELIADSIVVRNLLANENMSETDIDGIIKALRGDPVLTSLLK